MDCIVDAIVVHVPAVKEFQLRRVDGAPLPGWPPGAHVVLRWSAADGRAFENRYSLVGAPGAADTWRIAVQREDGGRGGSRSLHEDIDVGSTLAVDGPFDDLRLGAPAAAPGARTILVAGGIGITPLVSLAHALDGRGTPFALHCLARDADRLVLLDEVRGLRHSTVATHLSAQAGRTDPAALLGPWHAGDACYACGPAALLQDLAAAAARLGWPAGALHLESFGARRGDGDGPLTVELALSQLTVQVEPGTSILDALVAADAFVSWECRRGECGQCYTRVLEGAPLHRDVCLTPAMRAEGMCTCVSWAGAPGRLVLEL